MAGGQRGRRPAAVGLLGAAVLGAVTAWAATALFPSSLYTWGGASRRCAATGSGGTIWAACSVDGDCGVGAPAGACVETIVPNDFDQLAEEVEAIESFLGTNGRNVTVHPDVPYCASIENLAAADDDVMLVAFPVAVQTEDVSCHCSGTCTTPAQVTFQDDDGNALGGAITCSSGTGDMAWTDKSGETAGDLNAGERLLFDVTNTPNPDATDEYLLCATFSKQ